MAASALPLLQRALQRGFAIEYQGFLTNHLVHGALALASIGATPGELNAFYDDYVEKLELEKETVVSATEDDEIVLAWPEVLEQSRGLRKGMPGLQAVFDEQLRTSPLDDVLVATYDKLAEGINSNLLHSIIQTGYSLLAWSAAGPDALNDTPRQLVAEALAYNVFGYHSFGHLDALDNADYPTETTAADPRQLEQATVKSLAELLKVAKEDARLAEAFGHRGDAKYDDHPKSGPQRTVDVLLDQAPEAVAELQALLPCLARAEERQDGAPIQQLAESLTHAAVWLYAHGEQPNDFVVLHAVTSSWAVLQLLPHLSASPAVQRKVLGYFEQALVMTLLAHGNPTYNDHVAPYRDLSDPSQPLSSSNPVASWDDLFAAVRSNPTQDEHIPKLVFSLHDLVTNHPNLAPHDTFYRQVCLGALSHDLVFAATSWPLPSQAEATAAAAQP